MSEQSESRKPSRARRPGQTMPAEDRARLQEVFLSSFRKYANISAACDEANIALSTPYDWKKRYPTFAKQFEEAEQRSNDSIDREIYRRGVEGWEEPLVSAGVLVCNVRKYSDAMLTLLAKSRMAKYREKQQIDLRAQLVDQAEQAKHELLADLAASISNDKKQNHDGQPGS